MLDNHKLFRLIRIMQEKGLTATQALEKLHDQGMGYRRARFLSDWRLLRKLRLKEILNKTHGKRPGWRER